MITANAEVHSGLKTEAFPLAHFDVRNDVVSYPICVANDTPGRVREESSRPQTAHHRLDRPEVRVLGRTDFLRGTDDNSWPADVAAHRSARTGVAGSLLPI